MGQRSRRYKGPSLPRQYDDLTRLPLELDAESVVQYSKFRPFRCVNTQATSQGTQGLWILRFMILTRL